MGLNTPVQEKTKFFRHLIFSLFIGTNIIADDMYVDYRAGMYGHHLLIKQSNMDQPRKVAKPARGQLNREIKSHCR